MGNGAIPGWKHPALGDEPAVLDPGTWPPVVTRTYRGDLPTANGAFAFEAQQLAGWGFRPTAQTYAAGQRSREWLLFTVLAIFVGVSGWYPVLMLALVCGIAWIASAGPGALSVTYQRG
jgi:nitrate reductase NapE component